MDVWPPLFSVYVVQSRDNLSWCHEFHVISMWMTPKVSPSASASFLNPRFVYTDAHFPLRCLTGALSMSHIKLLIFLQIYSS